MSHLRNLQDLTGFALEARDGDIGRVKEVYFDDEYWFVRYFVVHTGGWLRGRDVLLVPRLVRHVDARGRRLAVELTRAQVEQSPPIRADRPVSRHYEAEYHRYYGLEPYWAMGPLGAPIAQPTTPLPSVPLRAPEHPHLRSSKEVCGYHITARDGDLGAVEDFVLDDANWRIAYIVVDTHKWLPGKKVLLAPEWITAVDWSGRSLVVNLDRKTIESAPGLEPSRTVSREYEAQLLAHYGKPGTPVRARRSEGAAHA